MPKETRTFEVKMAPHLTSEEGVKRINKAVAKRDRADFECFMLLCELAEDQGVLSKSRLLAALKPDIGNGITKDEADECAEYLAGEVERVLKLRRDADILFTNAMRGT